MTNIPNRLFENSLFYVLLFNKMTIKEQLEFVVIINIIYVQKMIYVHFESCCVVSGSH